MPVKKLRVVSLRPTAKLQGPNVVVATVSSVISREGKLGDRARASAGDLSEDELSAMARFMEEAIKEAKLAKQRGQAPNGAVIVDPALDQVISRGHDGTSYWGLGAACCGAAARAVQSHAESGRRDSLIFPKSYVRTSAPHTDSTLTTRQQREPGRDMGDQDEPQDASAATSLLQKSKEGVSAQEKILDERHMRHATTAPQGASSQPDSHVSTKYTKLQGSGSPRRSHADNKEEHFKQELDNGRCRHTQLDSWHPLRHAVMRAIERAAIRDSLLFPEHSSRVVPHVGHAREEGAEEIANKRDEHCGQHVTDVGRSNMLQAGETSSMGEDYRKFLPEVKRLRVEKPLEGQAAVAGAGLHPPLPRPYMCTGFDAYVVREPCTMCAMALVHSRVRRVIYGLSNPASGALGSKHRLHQLKGLNHHYEVFKLALQEADLGESTA